MTQITAEMIKELRNRTGVGMAKCKAALEEAKGDADLAIANLRKQGMASAVKKAGRETNEGAILVGEDDTSIALVEINAETDFVVKNEKFQTFAKHVVEHALHEKASSDLETFAQQACSHDDQLTIAEFRATVVHSLGENIQIRRIEKISKNSNSSYGYYSHGAGKLVALVELDGKPGEENLARDIAMHIAAEAPEYLALEDIPENIIAHEKEIAKAQVQDRPAHIADKIAERKVNAFFDQACLLRQKFVKNTDLTIQALVDQRAKEVGQAIKVVRFIRWKVGG